MSRKLILIHGRSQENKNPDDLKHEWVSSLERGLGASGLSLPIAETDILFPYYGNTLAQLTDDPDAENLVEVVVRGAGDKATDAVAQRALLVELLAGQGIDRAALEAEVDPTIIKRGPLDWRWVHAGLELLDRIDGINSAAVALVTNDVAKYLTIEGVRERLNKGVMQAFEQCGDDEIVVVAHSLGTIVAYDLLLERADANGWRVTDLITIGSPLGMNAVQKKYRPLKYPPMVGPWFNAFDERDVVALHPLDGEHFEVTPAIKNYGGVDNATSNRHGISGYLDDPVLAAHIHQALIRAI